MNTNYMPCMENILVGFGNESFKTLEVEQLKDNYKASSMIGYKSVLNSKSTEETLVSSLEKVV